MLISRPRIVVLGLLIFAGTGEAGAAEPSPPVSANSESDLPTQLKWQGDRLLGDLKYKEALAAYEKSYALSPNPAVLYNKGRCFEALEQIPEAVQAYERFLKDAPPELSARVPGLAQLIVTLRKTIAGLVVTSNVRGARIVFRDRVLGTTPLVKPIELKEGEGILEVYADAYESSRKSISLIGGEVKIIDFTLRALRPKGTPLPIPSPSPSVATRWWFWTAVAGAVASGVVVTIAVTSERRPDQGTYGQGQIRW